MSHIKIKMAVPADVLEDARTQAGKIVDYAKGNGYSDQFGEHDVDSDIKGFIGQKMFQLILCDHGIDCQLDTNQVGRIDKFDVIIAGKRMEVKTGHVKYGSIEDALSKDSFQFLVKYKQYEQGNWRGVFGYISMLLSPDYAEVAYMGWILSQAIKKYPVSDNLKAPNFKIPFSDLRSNLSERRT